MRTKKLASGAGNMVTGDLENNFGGAKSDWGDSGKNDQRPVVI